MNRLELNYELDDRDENPEAANHVSITYYIPFYVVI